MNDHPDLKGTAAELAKLVQEHGNFKFEGFKWLPCNIEKLAEYIGVHKNTVSNVIDKPPFHRIVRSSEEHGRHILLKLGTELCETDHVFMLRAKWVKGLVYYNHELAGVIDSQIQYLKTSGMPEEVIDRLRKKREKALKDSELIEKLEAGEKIPYQVPPPQMGLLRGMIQTFGSEDAAFVLDGILSHEGWSAFTDIAKVEGAFSKFYHWPNLGLLLGSPAIALQVALDKAQAKGAFPWSESERLLVKIAEFQALNAPETAA